MKRPAWVEQDIRSRTGRLVRVRLNKGRAIRAFCAECLGWEINPRECGVTVCPLFGFRGSFSPTRAAIGPDAPVAATSSAWDRVLGSSETSGTGAQEHDRTAPVERRGGPEHERH